MKKLGLKYGTVKPKLFFIDPQINTQNIKYYWVILNLESN